MSNKGCSLPDTRSNRNAVALPVRNVVNAIARSSGDHAGSASIAGSSVRRDEIPVATSTTQRSGFPVSVSIRCTAARRPLGDNAICW